MLRERWQREQRTMSKEAVEDSEDDRGVRDPELLADLGCKWIDGELMLDDDGRVSVSLSLSLVADQEFGRVFLCWEKAKEELLLKGQRERSVRFARGDIRLISGVWGGFALIFNL